MRAWTAGTCWPEVVTAYVLRVLKKPGQRDAATKRQEELNEYVKLRTLLHHIDDWDEIKEAPAKSITAALIKVIARCSSSKE